MSDNTEENDDISNDQEIENPEENIEDNKYSVRDLVVFAGLQQPIEFIDAFNELMRGKLQVSVDDMREKFASSFFGLKTQEPDEDVSDENEDEIEQSVAA